MNGERGIGKLGKNGGNGDNEGNEGNEGNGDYKKNGKTGRVENRTRGRGDMDKREMGCEVFLDVMESCLFMTICE